VQWGKDNSLPVSGPLTDYELRKTPLEVVLTQAGFGVPYIHTQPMPALNWAINHNLGFRPDITLAEFRQRGDRGRGRPHLRQSRCCDFCRAGCRYGALSLTKA
jgi:hypothetical protein